MKRIIGAVLTGTSLLFLIGAIGAERMDAGMYVIVLACLVGMYVGLRVIEEELK